MVTKKLQKFEYMETGFHDNGESRRIKGILNRLIAQLPHSGILNRIKNDFL